MTMRKEKRLLQMTLPWRQVGNTNEGAMLASQAGTPESQEGTPGEPVQLQQRTVGGNALPTSQGDAIGNTTGITGTEGKRTRSGQKTKPACKQLIEAMVAKIGTLTSTDVEGEIFCYQAMYPAQRSIRV
jgi:hypothetical protein